MDKLTRNLHKAIISTSEQKLGRDLSVLEKNFIESRLGYIALEVILDSVQDLEREQLIEYLNSEDKVKINE